MSDEEESEGEGEGGGAPEWMATFADLATLLLCFFVLILSFANMDIIKFRAMVGSLRNAFGVQVLHPGHVELRTTSPIEFSQRESTAVPDVMDLPQRMDADHMRKRMMTKIERVIVEQNLENIVETEETDDGVVVRVKGQLLFTSGGDQLSPESFVFLKEIAKLAEEFPYRVSVEGHTDTLPIKSARFPTNWHLASGRAIAVLRYFAEVEAIDPGRLAAVGYGDTRPLRDNDTAEGRAENRRVEFVFHRPEQTSDDLQRPGDGPVEALRDAGLL